MQKIIPVDKQFIRIATKGFVPLFDTDDKDASKMLLSQIRELASGKFHDRVGKDPSLAGKSLADFLKMVAAGEVAFRTSTAEKSCIIPSLEYDAEVPCTIGFLYEKMFVAPPVFEARLDEGKLLAYLDLRIELKNLMRPSELKGFLQAVKSQKVTGVSWSFTSSQSIDPIGYSCRVFRQKPTDYTFEFHDTKRELITVE